LGRVLVQIRDEEEFLKYRIGVLAEAGRNKYWYKAQPDWLKALHAALMEQNVSGSDLSAIFAGAKEELVVFTPKGHIKTFRIGATAYDYARAIHTELFLRATSVKVDGVPQRLSYKLREGDKIQILAGQRITAELGWIDFLYSRAAISSLRQHLRSRPHHQIRSDAISALGKECNQCYLSLDELIASSAFCRFVSSSLGMVKLVSTEGKEDTFEADIERLLTQIGTGEIRASDVINGFWGYCSEIRSLFAGEESGERKKTFSIMIETRDRPELFADLGSPFGKLKINISMEKNVLDPSTGELFLFLTLDVFGAEGAEEITQIEEIQSRVIAGRIGKTTTILDEPLRLLRQMTKNHDVELLELAHTIKLEDTQ
ncbi:MAG: TGS domain-containing protein, partial [Candidatus Margulisiibacteriota bacterium]